MLDHSPALHLADEQRVGQLELAHQRVRDIRVDGDLVGVQRRSARPCTDRSRRCPASRSAAWAALPRDDALERERAGLGADDAQPGRLGQQRGVEAVVALELGEGAEPAVLLGRDAHQDDLGRVGAGALDRRERVQRGDQRRLSCPPRRGRAGGRPRSRPTTARAATAPFPPDDVDVPVERDPAGPRAGQRRGHAEELGARGLLPGMVGVRAQRGEVVLVQVGVEPGSVAPARRAPRAPRARRR